MTSILPILHTTFLETLTEKLKQDDRFEALLAGGSMVHGGFDEYSDIDLVPVVRSNAYRQVLAERRVIRANSELLHVDLKFLVLSDLAHLVERPRIVWARDGTAISSALDAAVIAWPNRSPEWFEERAWIWLHYGATKLQRGELFEAMGMTGRR